MMGNEYTVDKGNVDDFTLVWKSTNAHLQRDKDADVNLRTLLVNENIKCQAPCLYRYVAMITSEISDLDVYEIAVYPSEFIM